VFDATQNSGEQWPEVLDHLPVIMVVIEFLAMEDVVPDVVGDMSEVPGCIVWFESRLAKPMLSPFLPPLGRGSSSPTMSATAVPEGPRRFASQRVCDRRDSSPSSTKLGWAEKYSAISARSPAPRRHRPVSEQNRAAATTRQIQTAKKRSKLS